MVTFLSNQLYRFRRPPPCHPPVNLSVFVRALWINSLNCMLTQAAVNSAACEALGFLEHDRLISVTKVPDQFLKTNI